MLILLPPSEGKTPAAAGPTLTLENFQYPEFNSFRREIINELIAVSKQDNALEILAASSHAAQLVAAQQKIFELPCAFAYQIYTGVLFEALQLFQASKSVLDFAAQKIIIFSGLFGVLSPLDLIPAYRLSAGTKLPNLGNNKTFWKRALKNFSAAENELVIDCRSGNYQFWNPPASAETVQIGAVTEKNGQRKVVSHYAKHFRGLLAHEIVQAKIELRSAQELADFARETLGVKDLISDLELTPKTEKEQQKLILIQGE